MYNTSEQFHSAVYANSPKERILFTFSDNTIFTNEDIHMTNGVKITEAVNFDEDMTIGTCPAASLEATIMNYHGLLSGYGFGECGVSLGVRTATATQTATDANVKTVLRYGTSSPITFTGHLTRPYLKVNGFESTAQPPFPVYAIVTVGEMLYCISEAGEVWVATWVDGLTWSELAEHTWSDVSTEQWDSVQGVLVPITDSTFWQELNQTLWRELAETRWSSFVILPTFNDFMKAKFAGWVKNRRGMSWNNNTLYEFTPAGSVEKFEYIKLGTFIADTPSKRKIDLIDMVAYDRLTKFDVNADTFLDGLTYPITLGEIFAQLCTFVGVTKTTTTFINSTRSFSDAPIEAKNISAKDILAWIAGAACSVARMTRDGELELAWFGTETVSIPMTQYFNIDAAEYEVAEISALQIVNSESDIGVVIGEGTNAYIITDNPFLYGTDENQIRTLGTPIYNRLITFPKFAPITASAICDWSIQAGDIIEIVLNGTTYKLPVFCQTITWRGNARVSYENTGQPNRATIQNAEARELFNQKRAMHEMVLDIDGLTSRVYDAEGNISTLEQFADNITLSVENGGVSSTIKLMNGEIELVSQTISFSGLVKFTDLSTDGNTTINGSNITTGTVAAARIDVDRLQVKHLDGADGSFSGTLSAGVSITSPLITGGTIKIPDATNPKFTVNSDGSVSASNLTITGGSITLGSNFSVDNTGKVTASNLAMTGGSVKLTGVSTILNLTSEGQEIQSALALGKLVYLKYYSNSWITDPVFMLGKTSSTTLYLGCNPDGTSPAIAIEYANNQNNALRFPNVPESSTAAYVLCADSNGYVYKKSQQSSGASGSFYFIDQIISYTNTAITYGYRPITYTNGVVTEIGGGAVGTTYKS